MTSSASSSVAQRQFDSFIAAQQSMPAAQQQMLGFAFPRNWTNLSDARLSDIIKTICTKTLRNSDTNIRATALEWIQHMLPVPRLQQMVLAHLSPDDVIRPLKIRPQQTKTRASSFTLEQVRAISVLCMLHASWAPELQKQLLRDIVALVFALDLENADDKGTISSYYLFELLALLVDSLGLAENAPAYLSLLPGYSHRHMVTQLCYCLRAGLSKIDRIGTYLFDQLVLDLGYACTLWSRTMSEKAMLETRQSFQAIIIEETAIFRDLMLSYRNRKELNQNGCAAVEQLCRIVHYGTYHFADRLVLQDNALDFIVFAWNVLKKNAAVSVRDMVMRDLGELAERCSVASIRACCQHAGAMKVVSEGLNEKLVPAKTTLLIMTEALMFVGYSVFKDAKAVPAPLVRDASVLAIEMLATTRISSTRVQSQIQDRCYLVGNAAQCIGYTLMKGLETERIRQALAQQNLLEHLVRLVKEVHAPAQLIQLYQLMTNLLSYLRAEFSAKLSNLDVSISRLNAEQFQEFLERSVDAHPDAQVKESIFQLMLSIKAGPTVGIRVSAGLLSADTVREEVSEIRKVCAYCSREPSTTNTTLNTCAGCKSVKYCSVECQKADWPIHKAHCQKLKLEREKKAKQTSSS